MKLAIERPDVLRDYNVVFGGIYPLNEQLLPAFDVVRLFHLCEFWGGANNASGAFQDLEVAKDALQTVRIPTRPA